MSSIYFEKVIVVAAVPRLLPMLRSPGGGGLIYASRCREPGKDSHSPTYEGCDSEVTSDENSGARTKSPFA